MDVLVIGDKDYERVPVAEAVRALGHNVAEAVNGEQAWELYRETQYDCIFSDYLMPKLDGLQLCERIRSSPHPDYTYFVIVSSRNQAENILAGFRSGVDDYLPKPVSKIDLECRLLSAERVTSVHKDLANSNEELRRLTKELRRESRRDALTGIGNRLKFRDDLPRFLDEIRRYGHRYYLALCDIDNFKRYNDTYGHLEGDRALKAVASILVQNSRSSDACYRFGGEEFLLVLTGQEKPGAEVAAERLRQAVEGLRLTHSGNPDYDVVTLSIGLTKLEAQNVETFEVCLKRADDALYQSKNEGRNRVTNADAEEALR